MVRMGDLEAGSMYVRAPERERDTIGAAEEVVKTTPTC